jgi:hypothetical protein
MGFVIRDPGSEKKTYSGSGSATPQETSEFPKVPESRSIIQHDEKRKRILLRVHNIRDVIMFRNVNNKYYTGSQRGRSGHVPHNWTSAV